MPTAKLPHAPFLHGPCLPRPRHLAAAAPDLTFDVLRFKLEEEIDAVQLTKSNGGVGATMTGDWLLDMFARLQVTCETVGLLVASFESAVDMVMETRQLSGPGRGLKLEQVRVELISVHLVPLLVVVLVVARFTDRQTTHLGPIP